MNKILILDTETTGILNHPTRGHPEIVELAYIDVSGELAQLRVMANLRKPTAVSATIITARNTAFCERYNPSMAIHPDASKIHGMIKKDLIGKRPSTEAVIPEDITCLVGHNIQYDHRCLGKPDVKLICTMKIAKMVQKAGIQTFSNHKLETLVQHYYPEQHENLNVKPHSALQDCVKTILVFIRLIEHLPGVKTWEELYNFQTKVKV